jgi:HEPN domain-containing protein
MSGKTSSHPSEHVQERTRAWFRKAEHELAFLDYAPFDLVDPPTDTAGKMAHMVGEYSLKAYLMLNKRQITKTHDLVQLVDECIAVQKDADFELIRDDCQVLTQYRVDFVYPSSIPEQISVNEARATIQRARRVYDFVLQKARALGYSAE